MRQFVLMAWSCALAMSGYASAEQARTAAELRALPPAAAEQVAKSDLLSVLQLEHDFKSGLGRRALEGVSFVTPAFGTSFNGLCQRDSLVLRYAATTTEGKPEDRPLKPYDVNTTAWFADIGMADTPGDTHPVLTPGCEALDGKTDVDWFPAQDAWQAAEAVLLLRKVRAQLKDGQLASCDSKCKDVVLTARHIFRITDCAGPEAEAKGELCYAMWMDSNISVAIKAKRGTTLPGDIESVVAGTLVIVG